MPVQMHLVGHVGVQLCVVFVTSIAEAVLGKRVFLSEEGTRPLSPLAGDNVPHIGYGEARIWLEASSTGHVRRALRSKRPARAPRMSRGTARPTLVISRPTPSSSALALPPSSR